MRRGGASAFAAIVFATMLLAAASSAIVASVPEAGAAAAEPSAPEPLAAPPIPEPSGLVGVDFLVSYDDDNSALHPSFAATPPESMVKEWDGTMHVVWDERNDGYPWREIHYSQSLGASGGREWSNDDPWEGDRVVSDPREKGFGGSAVEALASEEWPTLAYSAGDAVDPSVAVDMHGFVHVVWREMYPDGTWEVHYTRSRDNGRTWSFETSGADVTVSNRGQRDGPIPFPPVVAVSNNRGNVIVHALWTELDPSGEFMEIFISRSFDGGDHWTGWEMNEPVSDPGSRQFAMHPSLAAAGEDGEVLCAAWQQFNEGSGTREIFSAVSRNFGDSWRQEMPISLVDSDGCDAGPPSAAANSRYIAVSWPQVFKETGSVEIMYSYSGDFGDWWLGMERDFPVSCFEDHGEGVAKAPSVALSPAGTATVVWTEMDENALRSEEVHVSVSHDIGDPKLWSGLAGDDVISKPDGDKDGQPANAANVSVGFAFVDGSWRYRAVWDEVNYSAPGDYLTLSSGQSVYIDDWEIVASVPADYSIPVQIGWNLVSVPVELEDQDILSAFSDEAGDGLTSWDRAMWYDPTDAADHWKQHNKNWASAMNDLTDVDHTMAVWIRITSVGDGYLTVTGFEPGTTSISLRAGWNFVGYPALDDSTYTVANLKSDTGATVVEGFKGSATYKTEVLGDAIVLRRGMGYWVRVNSDATWTVSW
jgi:hypothetical protein